MIKVNIVTAKGFNADELRKAETARIMLNKILNNEKFRERVLRFTTDGLFRFYYRRSFFGKWIDVPHTNRQVYDIITQNSGEQHATITNIDLNLELLPGGRIDELGYTNPDNNTIYTYCNWFNNLTMPQLAGHLSHEWCHQLGFTHADKPHPKLQHSVPFGIGTIAETISWDY